MSFQLILDLNDFNEALATKLYSLIRMVRSPAISIKPKNEVNTVKTPSMQNKLGLLRGMSITIILLTGCSPTIILPLSSFPQLEGMEAFQALSMPVSILLGKLFDLSPDDLSLYIHDISH